TRSINDILPAGVAVEGLIGVRAKAAPPASAARCAAPRHSAAGILSEHRRAHQQSGCAGEQPSAECHDGAPARGVRLYTILTKCPTKRIGSHQLLTCYHQESSVVSAHAGWGCFIRFWAAFLTIQLTDLLAGPPKRRKRGI